MSTTRWKDDKTKEINTAIELLIDKVDDYGDSSVSYCNWKLECIRDNNSEAYFNGQNITFNIIHYSYDQITKVPDPGEDRIVPKDGLIIVYFNGNSVNYIIDQNSTAQKNLRKILSYDKKQEIVKNTFDFSSDFFIWLIYRIYNNNCTIENIAKKEVSLYLDALKGFRGNTEDLQNKVSADGEAVLNIISTLSFLLENGKLNQIKLDLTYTNHEQVSLILQSSTVKVDEHSYQGIFEQDDDYERWAKLYLLVYLEILPILELEYRTDIAENNWGTKKYIEFMNSVATKLNEKIQMKISLINNT